MVFPFFSPAGRHHHAATPPCLTRRRAELSRRAPPCPSPSPAHAPSVANLVPGRAPNMQRSFGQPLPLHPSWEPAKPIYPIQSAGTRDHPAVGRDLALGGARHGRAPRQGRSSVEHAQRGGRHAIVSVARVLANPPSCPSAAGGVRQVDGMDRAKTTVKGGVNPRGQHGR